MGLLYVFPDNSNDAFVKKIDNKIFLRSYPLPNIFYGYYFAICIVLVVMYIVIKAPLSKLLENSSMWIDYSIVYGVYTVALMIIVFGLFMLQFKKIISVDYSKNNLHIRYCILGIAYRHKIIKNIDLTNRLEVYAKDSTPNIAKIKNQEEMAGHFNRGYFELVYNDPKKGRIFLDRSNQKKDLVKLKKIIANE